ncbi:MAG: hypothetical protein AAF292_01685 [Pseudomonadota bacterium]
MTAITNSDCSEPRHAPLQQTQMVRLTIVGLITWLGIAFLLHYIGTLGAYEGTGRLISYGIIALLTPSSLLALMPLCGIARNQIVLGTAWVVGVASVCDGLALVWFTSIYGGTQMMVAGAGSTLLWGVGAACLFSFFVNREPSS